jgi:UDP-N-acetylmuramate--alanine ligase
MKLKHKKIHFIGIGGAGMCGIAEIMKRMGHSVSGSDLQKSQVTTRLTRQGIKIFYRHHRDNIKGSDIVVHSSAIKKDNPELKHARELEIPILSRGEMLAELMTFKRGIAIAGAHGKTTTTAMLASIFTEAKLDPTVVIGGKFLNIDSNARHGKGNFLIAEVDESDKSFLKTLPTVALINNIDPDHINMWGDLEHACYKNFEDIKTAFADFIRRIPLLGKVIINKDDPVLYALSKRFTRDYVYFSLKDKKASFYAGNIKDTML